MRSNDYSRKENQESKERKHSSLYLLSMYKGKESLVVSLVSEKKNLLQISAKIVQVEIPSEFRGEWAVEVLKSEHSEKRLRRESDKEIPNRYESSIKVEQPHGHTGKWRH